MAAQRRFVAWLAIAAMALLVLAPDISRYLVAAHAMPALAADCPEHAGHADHAATPDPQAITHGDACGYCTLFGHTPVTPTVYRLAIPAAPWLATAPVQLPAARGGNTPIISAAPRGPPPFSFG
ncbi:MAG TPA: DUF2946 domain-containing protein [Dyella sp.]|uniref:DUF2946 domain-containing protein n=1 Tax=Dyella sp. TaxID=1869338 RepID=UPI002F933A24